jgi:WD40 repeat protein
MRDYFNPHEALQTHDVPFLQIGAISRRRFMVLLAAGLVAGCQATQGTAPTPTKIPASTTIPVLIPSERIAPENGNHVVQLALLEEDTIVRSVAWSPDGSVLADGANSEIHLWDVKTGKRRITLQGHTGQIDSLSWRRDGLMLASASIDGTVRLWDTRKWAVLTVLTPPSSDVALSVDWSPDGSQLVSGYTDGSVQVWDARTGKSFVLEKHLSDNSRLYPVWGVAWSPDRSRIASTRYDGIVHLWDARTGKNLVSLQLNDKPNGVAWSPDGKRLAVTVDGGAVQLWDAKTHKMLTLLLAHQEDGWSYAVAWSPDGRMLASSRQGGLVQIWDTRTGKELTALQGHRTQVRGTAWSPDGLRIASGSDDGTIRLWGVR